MDHYPSSAERVLAGITIYLDCDEPWSFQDGVLIGANARRILDAMRRAGFVVFKTSRRDRRAREE